MGSPQFDRILSTARIRLAGALDAAIQYELFSVLDEFLQDSSVWKDELSFTVSTTALKYTITPTAGQLIRLEGLTDSAGNSVWGEMEMPGTVKLATLPTEGQKYTATVALSVADPVTRDAYPLVPVWITKQYNTTLIDGVLGHMMGQHAKPYSNETLSVYHLRRFRNGIAQARVAALQGNTKGNQSWAFPQAFAVKRKWR